MGDLTRARAYFETANWEALLNEPPVGDQSFLEVFAYLIFHAKMPTAQRISMFDRLHDEMKLVSISVFEAEDFLHDMTNVDPAFVAHYAPRFNPETLAEYQLACVLVADDVETFAAHYNHRHMGDFHHNAEKCIRLQMTDAEYRVRFRADNPLIKRLLEEYAQPTDQLDVGEIIRFGNSPKLVQMFVPDEEIVERWLEAWEGHGHIRARVGRKMAVLLARLATPEQKMRVSERLLLNYNRHISTMTSWFREIGELHDQRVLGLCMRGPALFRAALRWAMMIGLCDDYFVLRGAGEAVTRYFAIAGRLPMELQALVALRSNYRIDVRIISVADFNDAWTVLMRFEPVP